MQGEPYFDECLYLSSQKDRLNVLPMVLALLMVLNLQLLVCTAEEKTSLI